MEVLETLIKGKCKQWELKGEMREKLRLNMYKQGILLKTFLANKISDKGAKKIKLMSRVGSN